MIKTFRHKLLLFFIGLSVLIIATTFLFVNLNINNVSRKKIINSLLQSEETFSQFFQEQNSQIEESIETLIVTQPNIRAVLGTFSTVSDDGLFGDDEFDEEHEDSGETEMSIKEASELIESTLDHLPLFQESELFTVFDASATVLFNKENVSILEQSFLNVELIRSALKGKNQYGWWTNHHILLQGSSKKITNSRLFQVFIHPVILGGEVRGAVLVGKSIHQKTLSRLKSAARSNLSIVHKDNFQIHSEPQHPTQFKNSKSTDKVYEVGSSGEEFIILEQPLKNSLSKTVGNIYIYRSLSEELLFYKNMKQFFLIISLLSALLAIFVAFFLSKKVHQSISLLMKGVQEIRDGNLDYIVRINSNDEFEKLSNAFNTMTNELKEKNLIKKTFKRYVSPKIVDSLLKSGEKLNLGGDEKSLIILFTDIAGFTSKSENLNPTQVVTALNKYLSEVSEIIEQGDGIIDKFIGDAVMAYWIAGENEHDVFTQATQTMIMQFSAINKLRASFPDDSLLNQLNVRMGLHYGSALMGNIGSANRMDYTIIGDDVNFTARLEALNKNYKTQCLISSRIQEKISPQIKTRPIEKVIVSGKDLPVDVYEVIIDKEPLKPELYIEGHKNYQDGEFKKALSYFSDYVALNEEDETATLFLNRCKEWSLNPPDNWNGIYRYDQK